MTGQAQADLQERIGALILGGYDDTGALSEEEHLLLVSRAAAAEQASQELQRRAVTAARSAGVSWAALGRKLGMTRQAAQQRFGGRPDTAEPGARERWLGPVTAFNEMAELELAGTVQHTTLGEMQVLGRPADLLGAARTSQASDAAHALCRHPPGA